MFTIKYEHNNVYILLMHIYSKETEKPEHLPNIMPHDHSEMLQQDISCVRLVSEGVLETISS